ncbi:MAG: hypothetical protein PF569_07135 [Candidatus Woesearchaeota archaeon]|jgi:hypothetical protein|nr:hypothetical protein [Candidatus Woesearchaeota archaeon]
MNFKKAISLVVAIALLLVVSVVAVVGFQNWYSSYSSEMFNNLEQSGSNDFGAVGVEAIIGDQLYVKNSNYDNLIVSKVIVDGEVCYTNISLDSGISNLSLSSCLSGGVSSSTPDVVIMMEDKIVRETIYVEDVSLSGSVVLVCNATTPEGFQEGDGSLGNPWKICNCSQLQLIGQSSSVLLGNFSLIQNIDCSDTINWNAGLGFDPLGNIGVHFKGSLDGNYKSIMDLFIDRSLEDNVGLFGVGENGYIFNLYLNNVNITGKDFVGALIGYDFASTIDLIVVSGVVQGNDYVGGLIGGVN